MQSHGFYRQCLLLRKGQVGIQMSWCYRAGYVVLPSGERWYTVREFYRDTHPDMPKRAWTDACSAGGETKQELIEDLEMMLADVKKRNAFHDTVTDLKLKGSKAKTKGNSKSPNIDNNSGLEKG